MVDGRYTTRRWRWKECCNEYNHSFDHPVLAMLLNFTRDACE